MNLFPVHVLFLFAVFASSGAEELSLPSEEFPRIPHTEPADAIHTFEIEPGFEISLAAHEPAVMDPIAMTFDEKGRAYVLEMRGYSERRDEALGQVRLLTDTDGDGIFDQSSIFKDGLKWPTAILCYRGGIFVGATPDVFYFRDTDNDGVSDEERHIFTGFGIGKPELNMQALFNSFRWGPDNRIWGATAANAGKVTRPDDPTFEEVNLRGADFSFDPGLLDLRPENGTAQYGMSFDSEGRRFVCSNSRHLIHVAYERHQVRPNPLYSVPQALIDIPNDGAAAPVYRISADEPWRIVRTRWRVAGVVKGIVEGGGRVSGYFTSASGVHIYWGGAFGESFRNNAFIGDVGSNLVHRKIIESTEDSYSLVGRRADPDKKSEFLRSSDNWFRPTSFATGPDGCLYVTDMYRETIEHPWSLPAPIKEHLDLNSGFDRGRIYRISPKGFTARGPVDLSSCSDEELKGFLSEENPSQWHETTARRLLYERGISLSKPPAQPFPANLMAELPTLTVEEAGDDIWKQATYLNSLRSPGALSGAWREAVNSGSPLAAEVATMIGRSRDPDLVSQVAADLASNPPSPSTAGSLESLANGVRSGVADSERAALASLGFPPPSFSYSDFLQLPVWSSLKETSREILEKEESEERIAAAVSVLSIIGEDESRIFLENLLTSETTKNAVKDLLITAVSDPTVIATAFPDLSLQGRSASTDRVLSSPEASTMLLGMLETNRLPLSELPAALIEGLRVHPEKAVSGKAAEVLPPVVSRASVIDQYQPSLEMPGDKAVGKQLFSKICQSCHLSHEGEGIDLGPSLTSFATAGRSSLLERILDPNREVAPQYEAYVFTLENGQVLSGVIRSETTDAVTLRLPGGLDQTFPRREVASMNAIGQSLMPEGIENTITVAEMADLLAYLESAGGKE